MKFEDIDTDRYHAIELDRYYEEKYRKRNEMTDKRKKEEQYDDLMSIARFKMKHKEKYAEVIDKLESRLEREIQRL